LKKSLNSWLIAINGKTNGFWHGPRGALAKKRDGLTPRTPGPKHKMAVPISASASAEPTARKL